MKSGCPSVAMQCQIMTWGYSIASESNAFKKMENAKVVADDNFKVCPISKENLNWCMMKK